jgi:hypothetical protein
MPTAITLVAKNYRSEAGGGGGGGGNDFATHTSMLLDAGYSSFNFLLGGNINSTIVVGNENPTQELNGSVDAQKSPQRNNNTDLLIPPCCLSGKRKIKSVFM